MCYYYRAIHGLTLKYSCKHATHAAAFEHTAATSHSETPQLELQGGGDDKHA